MSDPFPFLDVLIEDGRIRRVRAGRSMANVIVILAVSALLAALVTLGEVNPRDLLSLVAMLSKF